MNLPRVGLIVPLREEFDYVASVLDILGDTEENGRVYHRFVIPGTQDTGILTVIHDMGLANGALAAHDLVSTFHVPLIAVIGTAAALDKDIRLGDVVIASEIIDYLQAAKATEDADDPSRIRISIAGTHWKPSAPLLSYVRNFPIRQATRRKAEEWSEAAHDRCRIEPGARPAKAPVYHVGHIASGDVVVGSEAFISLLKNHDRKCAAVEMEAGGAALSVYQNNKVELMVVRGVSDRAEKSKTATDETLDIDGAPNAWRGYAVRNATTLLMTLLAGPGFPWRGSPHLPVPYEPHTPASTGSTGTPGSSSGASFGTVAMALPAGAAAALTAAAVIRHHHRDGTPEGTDAGHASQSPGGTDTNTDERHDGSGQPAVDHQPQFTDHHGPVTEHHDPGLF
ncbi:5'-methylthioadenosine/S-adenosylhomocysteine nucleosidase family protein [Streptomyces uncialis]|uniref:5'-methylthioadenosine/S-adenosylhomocysteine nucleosidase family protein n=1 Tax=Streptomyces uncialis TaxID=1048205 RepID=UPI00225634D8|nr:hypothetical protein [Streptomyces uncialis]MCX4658787.1 hypothetical protein [Streptomyces uncialis]